MKHQEHKKQLTGSSVSVPEGQFESAFRKFRRKIEDSGLIRELQDRQAYVKPTTKRKQKKKAAEKRWARKLAKNQIPTRSY
jgi:small subunit ribosomal protein S21